MPSTSQCKYCGSAVSSSDQNCPNCGAPNEGYVAETKRQIFLPVTIDELKEYCAERGMPLLKMRFFIGEDYRHPRAFGIYKDGKDTFRVQGGKIIRLANVTDAKNAEQIYRFQNILTAMGVFEALEHAGAKDGDTIKISHLEFGYYK